MEKEQFSQEDRESLMGWMERRGGTRQQAEIAVRQLMKKATQLADEESIAPIEAMGRLLSKIAQAEKIMEENGIPIDHDRQ
ncbi:MAG: hypothetical protein AAGJ81_08450 [Verrucomicrobiota bacterium]